MRAVQSQRPTKQQLITLAKEDPETIADLVLSLFDRIDKLEERIATLELNSRNSSKPPSTDKGNFTNPPKPKSLRQKSSKKRGAQRNHQGFTLEKKATPDHLIEHSLPDEVLCKHCDKSFPTTDSSYQSRQVFDIPPIALEVTEHRVQQCTCPHCSTITSASFPPEVKAPVQYGANVQSFCIYLNSYQLIPYKRLAQTFSDLFNIPLSQGTIANILKKVGAKADLAVQPIRKALQASSILHCDETGCRLNAQRHWLHVASNKNLSYYQIDAKRGVKALENIGILKGFRGTLIHDCLPSYNYYKECKHGICNAHILRELVYAEEQDQQSWAKDLQTLLLEAKRRIETSESELLQNDKAIVNQRYRNIVNLGLRLNPDPPKTQGKRGRPKRSKTLNLLHRLDENHRSILAFYNRRGVPFDNNQAERDLRMMKTREKISAGFGSEAKAKNFCDLRSVISSSLKQGHNILEILSELILSPTETGQKLASIPE